MQPWRPPEVSFEMKDNNEGGLEININARYVYPKSKQNGRHFSVLDVNQILKNASFNYFGQDLPMRLILKLHAKPTPREIRKVARNKAREEYLKGNPSFIV